MNEYGDCKCLESELVYLVSALLLYTVSETGSRESLHGLTVAYRHVSYTWKPWHT